MISSAVRSTDRSIQIRTIYNFHMGQRERSALGRIATFLGWEACLCVLI